MPLLSFANRSCAALIGLLLSVTPAAQAETYDSDIGFPVQGEPVMESLDKAAVRRGVLRVGYAESNAPGFGKAFMTPTVKAFEEAFADLDVKVELKAYSEFDLQVAVVKHEVDAFVVSSGYYAYLADMAAGAVWLSTLRMPQSQLPGKTTGSVFVVRDDDARYAEVADLRTAIVAASSAASFDGWITALAEVANVTSYPKNYFGKTIYTGMSGLPVARLVLEKKADAGILRVCELETMVAEGRIKPGSLRVVGEKAGKTFACTSSTERYPALVLASQSYLPEAWQRRMAQALYGMPSEGAYAWTLFNDFQSVRRVVQRYGYAPNNHVSDVGFSVVEERYKYALVIGCLILLLSIFYSVSVSKIVARRTKALVRVIDEKDALEDRAKHDREKLSQMERMGIVSELSSMIAHELRQPVASLINYADGLSLYLGGKGHDPVIDEATREIARQAERVSNIVDRVRQYARRKEGEHRPVDLCDVLKAAYSTFRSGSVGSSVRISSDLVETAMVEGDPLELELLVVNTLKNARYAVEHNGLDHAEIRIRLREGHPTPDDPRWVLEIMDNGSPISDEKLAELSHPVTSEKFEGLGLGLSICRVIAERHRARLFFRRAEPQGLIVTLSMPQWKAATTS